MNLQDILAQVRNNPKLAWDSNLIAQYLRLGGTLSNGGIPVQSIPTTPIQSTSSTDYSSPSVFSAQPQAVKPPIPDWIYEQTTRAVMNGSLSPQQALSELQNMTSSGGQFSGSVNVQKLFPPGVSFQRNGDTFAFDNTGTGNVIKTSATIKQTNYSPRGITTGVPINDPDFQAVFSGKAQSGNYGKTPNGVVDLTTGNIYTNESIVSDFGRSAAERISQSGYTLNPKANFDLVSMDDFLKQAGSTLNPYYKSQFDSIASTLSTGLSRLKEDLGLKEAELGRTAEETRRTGQETLAERGLTFSGQRQKFDTDLSDKLTRALNLAQTEAFRSGQEALTKAEQSIGTANLSNVSLPSFGGRSLSFSTAPIIGEKQYEQTSNQQTLARALASDENLRRQYAYNLSNRSF